MRIVSRALETPHAALGAVSWLCNAPGYGEPPSLHRLAKTENPGTGRWRGCEGESTRLGGHSEPIYNVY